MSDNEKFPIDDLPEEMVSTIAMNLSPKTLFKLSQTSHKYKNLLPKPEEFRMFIWVLEKIMGPLSLLCTNFVSLNVELNLKDITVNKLIEILDEPAEILVSDAKINIYKRREAYRIRIKDRTVREFLQVYVGLGIYYGMRTYRFVSLEEKEKLLSSVLEDINTTKLYYSLLPFPNVAADGIHEYLGPLETYRRYYSDDEDTTTF